jgi:rsbT co-antagonist protein RsbR
MTESSLQDHVDTLQAALDTAYDRIAQLEQLLLKNQISVPLVETTNTPKPTHTHNKQEHERLHLYEALLHNALDGVAVADLTGRMIYTNPAFRVLSGFGDHADNSLMVDYFEPEDWDYLLTSLLPILHEKGVVQDRLRYRRYDGSHFIGHISAFVIFDTQHNPIAQAVIVRDMTAQVEEEKLREQLQRELFEAQQNLLLELSTPLLPISNDVILMPVIGEVDTNRAQLLMETLLNGISRYQASMVIIDITGVKFADTHIANTLIQIARAAQLLGTRVVVSGIGPEMAQTFVALDTSLNEILTLSSLQSSIAYAFAQSRANRKETP